METGRGIKRKELAHKVIRATAATRGRRSTQAQTISIASGTQTGTSEFSADARHGRTEAGSGLSAAARQFQEPPSPRSEISLGEHEPPSPRSEIYLSDFGSQAEGPASGAQGNCLMLTPMLTPMPVRGPTYGRDAAAERIAAVRRRVLAREQERARRGAATPTRPRGGDHARRGTATPTRPRGGDHARRGTAKPTRHSHSGGVLASNAVQQLLASGGEGRARRGTAITTRPRGGGHARRGTATPTRPRGTEPQARRGTATPTRARHSCVQGNGCAEHRSGAHVCSANRNHSLDVHCDHGPGCSPTEACTDLGDSHIPQSDKSC